MAGSVIYIVVITVTTARCSSGRFFAAGEIAQLLSTGPIW